MKKENNNISNNELNDYHFLITKKKKKYGLLIFFTTILLAISILTNYSKVVMLINIATIGLLMINRSCTFSYVRKNDIGEKLEFVVGFILIILSFLI